jgi:seryl-tRNA synthetase
MTISETPTKDDARFRDRLVEAGLLVLTGTDGIYGRSAVYEEIFGAVDRQAGLAAASAGAVIYRFPPVMPPFVLERTGYLGSFPDLVGAVSTFTGTNADHKQLLDMVSKGEEWTKMLEPAGVTLCPAACHPLYPTLPGKMPEGGGIYDVFGWCYRHEPSVHAARMQSFRMREIVYVGDAAGAVAQRDRWLQQGVDLLASLGLAVDTVVANDPFFGRIGKIMAENQRSETLKYEIVSPIDSLENPNAIASSNCHLDHFGQPFGISSADGEVAHSSCFAFGLDRISLALLRAHGTDPADWPAAVRERLWP